MIDIDNSTKWAPVESSKGTDVSLPPIQDTVRHDQALLLKREMTALMGAATLLEVAQGEDHPNVKDLLDKPMHRLPPIPDPSSPDYAKILELHARPRGVRRRHGQRSSKRCARRPA